MSHQNYASWHDETDGGDEDQFDQDAFGADPFDPPQLEAHLSTSSRVRAPTFAETEPPVNDALRHSIRGSIVGYLESNGSQSFVGMDPSDLPRPTDMFPSSSGQQQQQPVENLSPTPHSFQNFESSTQSPSTIASKMPTLPLVSVPLSPSLQTEAMKQLSKR